MLLDETIEKIIKNHINKSLQDIENEAEELARNLSTDENQHEFLKEHIKDKIIIGIKEKL